jgi:hypothetical protein
MFSSDIGRGRFFIYSALTQVFEILLVALAMSMTMGIFAFTASKPGPGREMLVTAVLAVLVMFVIIRGNLAWRRTRDAQGPKWILVTYIVLSLLFALLQCGLMLVYDFGDPESSESGLGMAGLGITALWWVIMMAKSAPGGSGPAGEAAPRRGWRSAEDAPSGLALLSDEELLGRAAALNRATAPAYLKSQMQNNTVPVVSRSPGGFGRRGLT